MVHFQASLCRHCLSGTAHIVCHWKDICFTTARWRSRIRGGFLAPLQHLHLDTQEHDIHYLHHTGFAHLNHASADILRCARTSLRFLACATSSSMSTHVVTPSQKQRSVQEKQADDVLAIRLGRRNGAIRATSALQMSRRSSLPRGELIHVQSAIRNVLTTQSRLTPQVQHWCKICCIPPRRLRLPGPPTSKQPLLRPRALTRAYHICTLYHTQLSV